MRLHPGDGQDGDGRPQHLLVAQICRCLHHSVWSRDPHRQAPPPRGVHSRRSDLQLRMTRESKAKIGLLFCFSVMIVGVGEGLVWRQLLGGAKTVSTKKQTTQKQKQKPAAGTLASIRHVFPFFLAVMLMRRRITSEN